MSLSMIELDIQTLNNILHIHILLDLVYVYISTLIGLDVFDGNFFTVDKMSNRLWHRILISNDPLEIVHKW